MYNLQYKTGYSPSVYGLHLVSAPNRYRKLLKNDSVDKKHKDEFGIDKDWDTQSLIAVELQNKEFPDHSGKPIGFQASIDNDICIAWEK